MLDLLSAEARRDPYPLYERVRGASPVLHDPRTGTWMLFDYDSVKRALNDHDAFSSVVSPPGSRTARWLLFSDPPRHTRLRALVTRAFTPRAVAALEPRIREITGGLLDRVVERGEMELVADFSVPLPLMVIAEMLGAPVEDWPRFRRWSDAVMGLIHTVSGSPEAERAVSAFAAVHAEMEGYLAVLLEERRTAPREDLLSRLVEAEVDGERLDDEDLLGFFQLLLLAGHETTTNLIGNAVLSLVENPDQLARLRDTPGLVPSAVEEVLRHRSPVQAMFRVTRHEVELRGQTIPTGRLVLAMIGSANRDPARFPDPNRFDVARDPNPHVAFGHGIHFCIGAPLARLEARVALPALMETLAELEPAGDAPWEPRQAFHVHGPERLPLRFARRERTPTHT
ncbi:MAG: cytochrome P450 [Gemmatimonadetes bacterium]|nr:cytochrome P450 [Gemmatimonadota bacterium]